MGLHGLFMTSYFYTIRTLPVSSFGIFRAVRPFATFPARFNALLGHTAITLQVGRS
jgi:hypothetical protein